MLVMATSPLEQVLAKILVQQQEAASRQEQQLVLQQQQLQKKSQFDMFERQERYMVTQQQALQDICNRDPSHSPTVEEGTTVVQSSSTFNREQLMDILAKQISEFGYEPDENHTFGSWYSRYEELFLIDAGNLSDSDKTRLLLRKVSQSVYQQYADVVLPLKPSDISFEVTLEKMKNMFGKKESLFSSRYKCFQTIKSEIEDYGVYIAKVNRLCENFLLEKFTKDNLKCLIFVSGLQSPKDANFRNEILRMLDEEKPEKPVTLEFINQDIQRTLQRQHDTKMIGNNQQTAVYTQAIHTKQHTSKYVSNHNKDDSKTPSTPCWFCGAMHYSKTCQYKNHKCKQCDRIGHKDGYCNVKNKQRHSTNRQQSATAHKQQTNSNKNSAQTRAIDNSIDNWFHLMATSPLEQVLAKILVQQQEAASRQEQQLVLQQQQLQKQFDMFERQERYMVTQQQALQDICNRDPSHSPTVEEGTTVVQSSSTFNREQLMDILAKQISEFGYEPDENHTFGSWYSRYEELFLIDAGNLSDSDKTRLLLRKVSQSVYQQYADVVLPLKPSDISFEVTLEKMKNMFGKKESLFSSRYKCFQTIKSEIEDYGVYIAKVNRLCENFLLEKFTKDNLKCLIFVSGLQSPKDANFRNEILRMLDEEKPEKPVTLEFINQEIQRTLQRQHDTKMIGNNQQTAVYTQAIHTKQHTSKYVSNHNKDDSKTPSTPCWFCGAMHYSKTCQYKNHKCKQCDRIGHKDGYCNVKNKQRHSTNRQQSATAHKQQTNSNKNSAQTRAIDNSIDNWFHRKHVNVLLNHHNVELQLDTAQVIVNFR
ncbi:hypothetical protein CVS40_12855 [Lucilia cuprina]|nr:hypothetical protein CVS40_12855 [Lucilia cuprina]